VVGLVLLAAVAGGAVWLLVGRGSSDRDAAIQQAKGGEFPAAEPALRRAYERDRTDADVVAALARGYVEADNILPAEEFLGRWIELKPSEAEPLQLRHRFYRKHREMEKAYADIKRLVELNPDNAEARRLAMNQAFDVGEFSEAESHCRYLLQTKPGDFELRFMLARIARLNGETADAARMLDELLQEKPKHAGLMMARAILLQETGSPEKAIPMFREILRIDPTRQRTAGYQLSLALEQTGQTEEAKKVMIEVRRRQDIEVFEAAIQNQPDNLDLRVRFAKTLLADGHRADGEKLLQAVLSRDPTFRPAHKLLAEHYEKIGETNRAAEHRRLAGEP